MSNLIFNIALGNWHFQITRWPWRPRISLNRHVSNPWWKLQVFCAFGVHFP